jgi:two-component system chemotaxis response regulator CheY
MLNHKARILIVDDFSNMRSLIRTMLSEIGYKNIAEAPDGLQAYNLITEAAKKNEGFSLLILDWNMPVMSGFELLKLCKSQPATKDIPILMITAESDKESVISAIQAGASNYVLKPITKDVFREKLHKIVSQIPDDKF